MNTMTVTESFLVGVSFGAVGTAVIAVTLQRLEHLRKPKAVVVPIRSKEVRGERK